MSSSPKVKLTSCAANRSAGGRYDGYESAALDPLHAVIVVVRSCRSSPSRYMLLSSIALNRFPDRYIIAAIMGEAGSV